ncbi:hypothetical protein AB832_03395 [Flavobacteriaceae bacterium (ex Bugula neritina AB1)]|nr:hypothetical protein AB832_03395 [Flavobacteriaceae bacterium (ex Bugula neritina AB1)]
MVIKRIQIQVFIAIIFISSPVFSQDDLQQLITKITTAEKFTEDIKSNVITFFSEEEKRGFVENSRIESLYALLACVKDKTSVDENFALTIFEINNIVKKNAELSEFLSELVSDIAYEYPENFVKAYSSLESSEQDKVDDCLFWLIEKDQYKEFKVNITKLEGEEYQESISRLNKIG